MSIGLQIIGSIIQTQSRDVLRTLSEQFFTDDEVASYRFLVGYFDRYGEIPSLDVMGANGFGMMPVTGNIQYMRDQLQNRFAYNAWMQVSEQFYGVMQTGNMVEARGILENVLHQWRGAETSRDTFTMVDAVQMVIADYQVARDLHGQLRGVPYGWDELDAKTGGCRPGDVTTIVARPGHGKTFSILRMAAHAWQLGNPVVVVSMEMNALETARRVLAMGSGVSADFIQRGQLSQWGEQTLLATADRVGDMPPFHLLIGDLSKSVRDVDALIQEHGPSAIYVDAGYLLNPSNMSPGKKRFELAADTIRELKSLAMSRNKPIIQTVQFNRQQKQDEAMSLDNIGQSDEIGQISSLVIGMKKGSAPHENIRRRYSVLKNRHGPDDWSFETNFLHSPYNMDLVEETGDGTDDFGEYDGTQAPQPVTDEWARI
jgi:replicative DNA helicase